MKRIKGKELIITAYSGLAIALLSAFTTIVGYTDRWGNHRSFNIIDFLFLNGNGFDSFVSEDYRGQVIWTIEIGTIQVLTVIGILAIVFAVVGLKLISEQRENRTSFILTLCGLILTMLPALIILVCVFVVRDNYAGTISCGIYPFVAPIAMAVCIMAATQMHRDNLKYRIKQEKAEGLIFKAGDLQ